MLTYRLQAARSTRQSGKPTVSTLPERGRAVARAGEPDRLERDADRLRRQFRIDLFAGEVQYGMDDQPALHHACSIVESRLGANVHVGDPLISAFSYQSEVGVPLAMGISSAPGFRVQALSVLIFDSQGVGGRLTFRSRDLRQ